MPTRTAVVGGAVLLAAALAGCQASPAPDNNVAPIAAGQYEPAFRAAVAVLRDAGFDVDRQDFRFGVVTTEPLGAPTTIELWKRTRSDRAHHRASTWNDQRQTASVTLEPRPAGGGYDLRVEVLVERHQSPTRRIPGPTSGAVFSTLAEPPHELASRDIPESYWTPVGRDTVLERRLLAQILERVGQ